MAHLAEFVKVFSTTIEMSAITKAKATFPEAFFLISILSQRLEAGATQVLFLQIAIKSLNEGGTCGMVIDEGVLFRTNE